MRLRILASVLGMMLLATSASAELKMGVVDVRSVMDGVPTWTKLIKNMKSKWEGKQKKLETRQKQLKVKKDQLEAKRVVSDPQTIAQEERMLMQNAQILAQQFMQEQQLISHQELSLKHQMLKRIEVLVRSIAEKSELAFVFEKGNDQQPNVLYNSSTVDITKKVLRAYKKTYKNKAFDVPDSLPKGFDPRRLQGAPAAK